MFGSNNQIAAILRKKANAGVSYPIEYYADADDSVGSWQDDGGGTTNLYQAIDSDSISTTNYVRSENDPSSSVYIVSLGSSDTGEDPDKDTDHALSISARKGETGGGSPGTIDLTCELRQGTTVIATITGSGLSTTFGVITPNSLTTGEAANITDYNNLNIRFTANKASGARTSWAEVAWAFLAIN